MEQLLTLWIEAEKLDGKKPHQIISHGISTCISTHGQPQWSSLGAWFFYLSSVSAGDTVKAERALRGSCPLLLGYFLRNVGDHLDENVFFHHVVTRCCVHLWACLSIRVKVMCHVCIPTVFFLGSNLLFEWHSSVSQLCLLASATIMVSPVSVA